MYVSEIMANKSIGDDGDVPCRIDKGEDVVTQEFVDSGNTSKEQTAGGNLWIRNHLWK